MRTTNIAKRLSEIMAEQQLRQIDILNLAKPFCEKYGVKLTKSDLSQYLSGQVEPGREKTFILGMTLNVDEAWLMGYNVPRERKAYRICDHMEHDNANLYAIQALLNNVGYNFSIFAKTYQLETNTGILLKMSPSDVKELEDSSIDHIKFVADSIIKNRIIPEDKVLEDSNGNRIFNYPKRVYTYMQKIACAGTGFYFDDIPSDTIEAPYMEGADFIIGVSGDSMEPDYQDGDYLYIKKVDTLLYGDVGIFTIGNECFLKEFGENGLISRNKTYSDIPGTEDVRLIGKVIGKAVI